MDHMLHLFDYLGTWPLKRKLKYKDHVVESPTQSTTPYPEFFFPVSVLMLQFWFLNRGLLLRIKLINLFVFLRELIKLIQSIFYLGWRPRIAQLFDPHICSYTWALSINYKSIIQAISRRLGNCCQPGQNALTIRTGVMRRERIDWEK